MATFHNIDHRHQHTNTYVVWGRGFAKTAARLGLPVDDVAAGADLLAIMLVEDAMRYPSDPGTPYRVAALRTPNGTDLRVRYRVRHDLSGETCCILDQVVED